MAVILGGRGNREIGTRVALRQFDGIRGLRGWIGRVSQFKLLTKSISISVFQIGNGFCFGTVNFMWVEYSECFRLIGSELKSVPFCLGQIFLEIFHFRES